MKRAEATNNSQWLGDKPQVSVGGMLEKESSFLKVVQFEDKSQDLRRGCGANRAQCGYHSTKIEDQKGFYPIL